MKSISIEDLAGLKAALDALPGAVLFRGQDKHYENAGSASFKTTFDRHPCIPEEMQRWSRYADKVLHTFHRGLGDTQDLDQAILQHYGWRSFFLDCSSSASVAAWFASHRYDEKLTGELCEDYQERPVILHKKMAQFLSEEGDGHLYVFDRERVRASAGAIDLAMLQIEGAHPRTQAQKAWLIGPLGRRGLPPESLLAHIIGPRSVFKALASEGGYTDTETLFPSVDKDPILAALLSLPWRTLQRKGGPAFPIPTFRRAIELPEYQESFVKISPSTVAFYEGKRIADTVGTVDGAKDGCEAFYVPSNVLYGTPRRDKPLRFPQVQALLTQYKCVAFEVDDLIRHPNMGRMVFYQKGIAVCAHEPDLVEVMEVMVRHPGLDMTGAGFLPGWHYRIGADGLWTRQAHPKDCNCGSSWPHEGHAAALHIVERFLANPKRFEGMN